MKKMRAIVLMAVIALGFAGTVKAAKDVMLRFSRLLCLLQRMLATRLGS